MMDPCKTGLRVLKQFAISACARNEEASDNARGQLIQKAASSICYRLPELSSDGLR